MVKMVRLIVFDKNDKIVFNEDIREDIIDEVACDKLCEFDAATAVAIGKGWVHIYKGLDDIEVSYNVFKKLKEVVK